jgi:hypothetical protein
MADQAALKDRYQPEWLIPLDLVPHELSKIVPAHSKDQHKELLEDIRENGLRIPIVLFDGKILDGNGRYHACKELAGITKLDHLRFRSETFPGAPADARTFVISTNVKRRHLSESQRALIAAQLATGAWGGDRSKASIVALTQEEAAKLMNVGEATVQRAASVIGIGNTKLVDAVVKGDVAVSAADKFAKSDRQDELLTKHNGDIVEAVKEAAKPTDEWANLWKNLKKKLKALKAEERKAKINWLKQQLETDVES